MQPSAQRMRRLRDKKREAAPASPSPSLVTPASSSSAAAAHPSGDAPVPAAPASPVTVTAHVTQAAPSDAPRPRLLETKIVQGPGADAFSGPTAIGAGDASKGTPIVEPTPPEPPRKTSPEEAAVIGKAYRAFCALGWGELAARNHEMLGRLAPVQMQEAVFNGGLDMVEKSATALAIKHNVRIPYGDELTVGLGGAIAAVGIVGSLKAGNDNKSTKGGGGRVTQESAAAPTSPSSPPPASPPPRKRAVTVTDAELVDDEPRDGDDDVPSTTAFDPDAMPDEAVSQ